jgi:hypothetical protein
LPFSIHTFLLCILTFSPTPPFPPGKEDWTKECVNGSSGSQTHLIKGLKPGTSYRVRLAVKDHSEATIHSTEELVITLPGEAACPERSASVYCRVGDNSISILVHSGR